MYSLPHILVKTYGGLAISAAPEMSGGGTQPHPHTPTKPPKPPKTPKKKK